ncbi:2-carboxy-1,4-naphthoquinone phytyltransferase, chloroplastic [Linum grandiflorum]
MHGHKGLSFGFVANASFTPAFKERNTLFRPYPGISASNVSKTTLYGRCKGGDVLRETSHKELKFKMKRFHRRAIPESKSSYDVNVKDDGDVIKGTLIWRAIKLPIYSVALIPLTVGGAAAYLQTGVFSAKRYFTLLISSVLIITWLNLSNDVYDFDTGADKNKKESVVNLVGSRSGVFIAAYFCLITGFAGLTWTSVGSRSIRANLLLTWAIICGYIYQCPPFRLSYRGLGEPLCFAAFGPFASTAFYLLLRTSSEANKFHLTTTILSASFLIGFTTTLILFCSHFHQIEEDEAVGKISPLVCTIG